VTFRRRTFPEVLDNLLTTITQGVAAEAHPFPPPGTTAAPFRHSLQRPPVAAIVSVFGSRSGEPHLFRNGADYRLLDDKQTLEWQQKGADLPDPGTLLSVNYYPANVQGSPNDLYPGSVTRTLAESFALEVAQLYAQLEVVYDSGFVDTATGSALEKVVALLGVERVSAGRAAGEVEFTRVPGTRGSITVPAGTRITTADGNVEYATTQTVTLAEAQNTIRVVARDLEANKPLPAGALAVLPVPIAGIAGVTNPAPTQIAARDETDDELRTRAKNFLHGSERATLGAITQAITRQGVTADVEEVADTPGRIEITPHAETLPPELQQRLLTAIEDVRPAGVLVTLKGAQPPRRVNLELRLTTAAGLLEQDLRAVQRSVRDKIEDYFSRLPAKEPGSVNRLVGLVLGVPEVQDVRLLSATWTVNGSTPDVLDRDAGLLQIGGFPTTLGELHLADPNLPTRLDVVVTAPQGQNPPDGPAIQAALAATLTYLDDANVSDLPPNAPAGDLARRALSFGKLLRAIPLPNKPAADLQTYDDAFASGTAPALPDATTIAPYTAQFILTLESGLSQILAAAGDTYQLTPFERLTLGGVQVQVTTP
jgi:hypothetical protein